MKHVSEDDLILYFYGEAAEADALAQHLVDCDTCRAEYSRLRSTVNAIELPVPERAADYEAQLWGTLRPRLSSQAPRRSFWVEMLSPQRWAAAGATAVIVLAAFMAGRFTRPQPNANAPTLANVQTAKTGSEKVLMSAVGDHLDRTQIVLVELVNTRAEGQVDISTTREFAQSLVDENRLYRQTAIHDKDNEIASVLDQVERVLIDISHHPDSVSADELEQLQQRIAAQGVLFKVRVIESKVRARTQPSAVPAPASSSKS
jgi:hypothetical protein